MQKNVLTMMKSAFCAAAAVLSAVCAWAPGAAALDIDPADYVALPDGTDIALNYLRFAHADRLVLKGGVVAPDSRLNGALNVAAYTRHVTIDGVAIKPGVFIPYGRYGDAKAGGAGLDAAQGFGDPFATFTVWLLNQPTLNRYMGVTGFAFAPLGRYQTGRALNMGENRWKGGLQVGGIVGLAPALTAELTADVTAYGDNRRAGDGTQTLAQRRSYLVQPWLRYDFNPGASLSAGYAAGFGGGQTLDGAANGLAARFSAVRLDYRQFVTETLQLAATASRDLTVRGGFQEAARLNLRIMKFF